MSVNDKMDNKKRYEIIETTADIGIKSYGKTLSEIFESCALGMFNIISQTKQVECKGELDISIEAPDLEQLLVDFLNLLLYYKDIQNLVFKSCIVKNVTKGKEKYSMRTLVCGEVFQNVKHIVDKDIKAATYHMLEINEKDGYATVIFDI